MFGVVSDYVKVVSNLLIAYYKTENLSFIIMTAGYQVYNQHGVYFITATVVDWVDIFSRKVYRDIVIESLKYCIREKGLKVYGYVIMTNHIHLIISSKTGKLSDTIRDFKKYTANQILEAIQNEPESRREWLLHRFEWNAKAHKRNEQHQVWMHDNHAMEITGDQFFSQKLEYIHFNPVRAGWVDKAEDYIYSSARAMYDKDVLIPISFWNDIE